MKATRTLACAVTVFALAACSLGSGEGVVRGTLDVANCWSGDFDLQPDFFAAVPFRQELFLRLQNGSDYESFSDGVQILVDSIDVVRSQYLGVPLAVSLPPSVTPPGVPDPLIPDPALVHFSLYLQRSCHLETASLYATRAVSLNPDGSCGGLSTSPPLCPGSSPTAASAGDGGMSDGSATDGSASPPPVASSTITFTSLFDGVPEESDAQKRLNEATFDVYLADPREVCPGGLGQPPRCRGHLRGHFKFYFERGKPAQPFP